MSYVKFIHYRYTQELIKPTSMKTHKGGLRRKAKQQLLPTLIHNQQNNLNLISW